MKVPSFAMTVKPRERPGGASGAGFTQQQTSLWLKLNITSALVFKVPHLQPLHYVECSIICEDKLLIRPVDVVSTTGSQFQRSIKMWKTGDFCDIERGMVVARHIVLGISHTTTREWAQKEKSSSQWYLCGHEQELKWPRVTNTGCKIPLRSFR